MFASPVEAPNLVVQKRHPRINDNFSRPIEPQLRGRRDRCQIFLCGGGQRAGFPWCVVEAGVQQILFGREDQ